MSSRWLPGLGIAALLIAALAYLLWPQDSIAPYGIEPNPNSESEDPGLAEPTQSPGTPTETESHETVTRTELAPLPTAEDEPEQGEPELAIHGRVEAVGLLTEEMLVRLVLLDVPADEVEEFDGLDILSWVDQDWVRRSKPRPIESDGSFVLRGTPPPARFGTVRRYIASIGIDTGGNGFPVAEGQTVLPVAISPALVGDEHPAESPLVLQAASPYRIRLNPTIKSEMLWAIHSITIHLNLERVADDSAPEDEEDSLLSEWLEVPPVPQGGLFWESWVSRVAPPLALESVFIDDWMHWEVEVLESIPIRGDIELDVTCEPVGHLVARLPVAIKPESMPYQRWASDLEEEVQYRVIPAQAGQFGTGWMNAYSWELIFGELPELDSRSRVDRARIAGIHFEYDPDQTWIQLGWFEPGSWSAEVITPDGRRWTSDPVQLTLGGAQVLEMRAEQELPLVQILLPPGYEGAAPQDAHFLSETGERLSLSVHEPERSGARGGSLNWEIRVPNEARALEAWVYDQGANALQVFHADFPVGDLPAEITLSTRSTEGELRPETPFPAFAMLVLYPVSEDGAVQYARSFVTFLDQQEPVATVQIRGLPAGLYRASGLFGDSETNQQTELEFEVR